MKLLLMIAITTISLSSLPVLANITNPEDSAKLTLQIKQSLSEIIERAKAKGMSFALYPDEMTVNCIGTKSFYYKQLVGTCVIDDEKSLWTVTVSDSESGPKYTFDSITSEL